MAEAYGWTTLYQKALQETDDYWVLESTQNVTTVLLRRLVQLSSDMTGREQRAILVALSDMNVLRSACKNRSRDEKPNK
jgi:hypothetical protein